MSTTTIIECKTNKRKRRHLEIHCPGSVMDRLIGPFRDNIRLFLQEHGEYENYTISGMPIWSTSLVTKADDAIFTLYVIEETTLHSARPFCSHCKFVGWGHHFVSKRKYHFIIPSDDNWNKPLKGSFLKNRNHLLHELIHCNGYGHLLSINTLDDHTNLLHGTDIMDFWDSLCTYLRTRKVSVNDYSRKKALELRLLLGVAYGTTWFGKWGYKFCHGSFGVTEDKYDRALQFFSTLRLDKIISDFENTDRGRKIKQIVRSYREVSKTPLVTISDLFQSILAFESKSLIERKTTWATLMHASSRKACLSNGGKRDKPISLSTFVSLAEKDCRWPAKRIRETVVGIVKLLKDNKEIDGKSAMTRQELRAGARSCIGDTGLIDFVLKSISCITVGNQIVTRSINPLTKVYEFKIHDNEEDKLAKQSTSFVSSLATLDSRWSKERLEHAADVIVNILKNNKAKVTGSGAMSRQELRDGARQCIGDTGLIDFVLKSINNYSMIGNQIISRAKNPLTRLIEFAIRDENVVDSTTLISHEPGLNVYGDILFLYRNVLLGYPEWDTVSLATRAILNSKDFVKEWVFDEEDNDQLMTLTCRVFPSFDELGTELTRPLCPGEVVLVSPSMTVGELKLVAQSALRDTYCLMQDFVVTQIGGLKALNDGLLVCSVLKNGGQVWVRGSGLDLDTELRYEGGPDDGKVDCVCGTTSDDGEKMVACDGCHVWQHTRCRDIDDADDPPALFLCYKCDQKVRW